MRDSRKTLTRAAHDAAARKIAPKLCGDFEAAQAFVDRVVGSRWFRKRFPLSAELGVVVKPLEANANVVRPGWSWENLSEKRTSREPDSLFPILLLPAWAMDELTILHALAHEIASARHDREFARAFLNLTTHFLGSENGKILREEFRAARIRWRRRPALTESRREELRARAVAREWGAL